MKNKIIKILICIGMVFLLTGCATTLTDKKGKAVTYEDENIKLTLNQNILCQPTNKGVIEKYNENKKKVDISKLPKCTEFKPSDTEYSNLWETIIVKPLAWLTIKVGSLVHSYGIALIILSILIRLAIMPFTKSTMQQSANMKKMQPEIEKINKKYEGKNDKESMQAKSMETMALYKKYKINPFSSCLFALIQIPLLFGFLEAINRVPVIFEENLFGLVLGTTPLKAITSGQWWYAFIVIIIGVTTFFSNKLNQAAPTPSGNDINPKTMMNIMLVMIVFMSINLSVAISLYWIASTLFTIVQSLIQKKLAAKKEGEVK